MQEKKTTTKEQDKISYQSLKVDIPKNLHKKFKIACVDQEVKMNEVIAQLIEQWLTKPEKK